MKKGIHPRYRTIEVVMTDGTVFKTRSCYPKDRLVLEIDSKSHPFFTGKQVLVDTAGRVDRFKKRLEKSRKIQEQRKQQQSQQQTTEEQG